MRTLCVFLAALGLRAEVRPLTLREAVALALERNTEVMAAKLEEERARLGIAIARDPFHPKIFVGSGLGYTNGIPQSVEGSTPSVVQARAVASILNRPQSLLAAKARQDAATTALDTGRKRAEVAFKTAQLYLDAQRAARAAGNAARQLESLDKVRATVELRVREGRALPVETRRAALDLALVRQRALALAAEQQYLEASLASVLDFAPGDRVRAVGTPAPLSLPATEEESVAAAIRDSADLRRIESSLAAKHLEGQAARAARLPRIDLVAQYALLARFNRYEDFFRTFQRHNGQVGMSVQVPLLPSPGDKALAGQADAEAARLRLEARRLRSGIDLETRRLFQNVAVAESRREVARLDLELARENVTLLLARLEEGRVTLIELEQSRVEEARKWDAFDEAQYTLELARVALLDRTGGLLAALQ